MDDSRASESLPRKLGFFGLWLLVVNGLVGAGIFGLPAGAAALAGTYSPLIFVLCALLILPVMLCLAELASYYNATGGPIRYVTDAFGRFAGFQVGWVFYIARLIAFSANSVLLVDSLAFFWPEAGQGPGRLLALALICGSLTIINVLGTVSSIRALSAFTAVKFLVLFGLVIAAISQFNLPSQSVFNSLAADQIQWGAAILLVIYAFVGFESAVVPAGESINPKRDMPRSLILGLAVVTVLYVSIQWVSVQFLPGLGVSPSPLLDLAKVLFGPVAAIVVMLGVTASIGGNLINSMYTAPRLTYALARDRDLPDWFATVHERLLTPANSIVFYGLAAFIFAAFGTFIWLAAATVLARLVVYVMSCATVPVLRPRNTGADRFVLAGGYSIPVLAIAACLWLLFQVSLDSFVLTAALIGLGSLLYAFSKWRAVRDNA